MDYSALMFKNVALRNFQEALKLNQTFTKENLMTMFMANSFQHIRTDTRMWQTDILIWESKFGDTIREYNVHYIDLLE